MFHNTTTICHRNSYQKNFFKEKRLAHIAGAGFLAGLKSFGSGALGVAKKGFSVGKILTLPIRLPFMPVWAGLKYGWKYGQKGVGKLEEGARCGKEVGLGAFNSTVGSIWELTKAPLFFVKKNIIDNARDIIKGVFTTPLNILRIPKNILVGIGKSITATRTGVKEVFEHTKNLNPFQAINSARKAIWETFTAPITTPLMPVLETPINVGKNIGGSVLEYPLRIHESKKRFRRGINRAMNCRSTAKTEMAAKQAAIEAAEAEALKAAA